MDQIRRRKEGRESGSYVYVEPHVVFLADGRGGLDGIEGAEDCGARGQADHEGQLLALDGLENQALQLVGSHLASASRMIESEPVQLRRNQMEAFRLTERPRVRS